MDEKSNRAVSLPEIDCKNDTTDSSVCCSTNASVTSTSGSRTSVTQCGLESSERFTTAGNDEIRHEMITALAWASCRAFKYQPSDPIHYLAHQLLRWRYGDVSERIPPSGIINTTCKNCSDEGEMASSSFCSDECEEICIGKSSENETATSQ